MRRDAAVGLQADAVCVRHVRSEAGIGEGGLGGGDLRDQRVNSRQIRFSFDEDVRRRGLRGSPGKRNLRRRCRARLQGGWRGISCASASRNRERDVGLASRISGGDPDRNCISRDHVRGNNRVDLRKTVDIARRGTRVLNLRVDAADADGNGRLKLFSVAGGRNLAIGTGGIRLAQTGDEHLNHASGGGRVRCAVFRVILIQDRALRDATCVKRENAGRRGRDGDSERRGGRAIVLDSDLGRSRSSHFKRYHRIDLQGRNIDERRGGPAKEYLDAGDIAGYVAGSVKHHADGSGRTESDPKDGDHFTRRDGRSDVTGGVDDRGDCWRVSLRSGRV